MPQAWILVEQNPTGWQRRNLAAHGVVWVAIVCRESLSSPETWPSGPVIQTSRGRTRKQFGEVLVVSRVAYHATCRKLIYVVSLMIEERLAFALEIRILRRKQMPNNPKRQRDIWLTGETKSVGSVKQQLHTAIFLALRSTILQHNQELFFRDFGNNG